MTDTNRTLEELQEIFKDGQPANSISAQDIRDLVLSTSTAAAQFQSFITQSPSAGSPSAPQSATLEVETFNTNITHSTITNSEEIQVQIPGTYELTVGLSIWDGGGGGGILTAWIEESTNGSPEWILTEDAVRRDGSNNRAGFAMVNHMDRHDVGDRFRVRWATDSANVSLFAFAPGVGTHPANHPPVPSVDVHIKRVGS